MRIEIAGAPDGQNAETEKKAARSGMNTEEILRRCLRDRIREHQEAALRGLVRQGPKAAHLIAEALAERTEQRASLIRALMELDAEKESLPVIRSLLREGGEDGEAAIEAVAAMNDQASVPELLQKLRDPALRERPQVIAALGKLGGDETNKEKVDDALFRELFSDRRAVRAAALQALSERKTAAANGKAAALRYDYFADVRALAVRLFGEAPARPAADASGQAAKAASAETAAAPAPAPASEAPSAEAQEK